MFNEGDRVVVVKDHEVYPGLYLGQEGIFKNFTEGGFYRVIFDTPSGKSQGFFTVEEIELVGGQVPSPSYMELFR